MAEGKKKRSKVRRETRYTAAGFLTVLLLLSVCAALGEQRIRRAVEGSGGAPPRQSQEEPETQRSEPKEGSLAASVGESEKTSENGSAEALQDAFQETSQGESRIEETAVFAPHLSGEEEALLKQIWQALLQGQRQEAARLIAEKEPLLQTFFYETIQEELWWYDGSAMADEIDGKGLVFIRPMTLFFGEFHDGKPHGNCLALQVLSLDEGVRYDYSEGVWEDGFMSGFGSCGYDYYDGVTGDSAKEIRKEGMFVRDRMEGGITYASVDQNGEAAEWSLNVEHGVVVIDDRWVARTDEEGNTDYLLTSDTNGEHVYEVGEEALGEERWKNRIEW